MIIDPFCLSEESKCMVKTALCDSIRRVPPEAVRDRKGGGVEGIKGKFNGNYLMLMPGLCLEDRTM